MELVKGPANWLARAQRVELARLILQSSAPHRLQAQAVTVAVMSCNYGLDVAMTHAQRDRLPDLLGPSVWSLPD